MKVRNKTIRVIYNFARSGGTLLNKILGQHPDCIILSEISPCWAIKPLTDQALDWFGLIHAEEKAEFSAWPYTKQITLLDARATASGRHLVIRDWTTVSYLNTEKPRYRPASRVLEQEIYLQSAGYDILAVVLARRSVEVYHSMKTTFRNFQDLRPLEFLRGYLPYCRSVSRRKVFYLEDLQQNPVKITQSILQSLDLPLDNVEAMVASFNATVTCTGNNTLKSFRPSSSAQQIFSTKQKHRSVCHADISHKKLFALADKILGYGAS